MTLNESELKYIENLEIEVETLRTQGAKTLRDYGQSSFFSPQSETNLIQWQLDLNEELERIDHLLRGHVIKRDNDGNEYWAEAKDKEFMTLNDYGVQLLMNVISFYLNRNTILSNYDEETINWKIKDLGDEIADLIFLKYEEMGLDTPGKMKLFSITVLELVDTIHSAYLRAMHGGERESLRTARHVTQSDVLSMPQIKSHIDQPRRFSMFKPATWMKR